MALQIMNINALEYRPSALLLRGAINPPAKPMNNQVPQPPQRNNNNNNTRRSDSNDHGKRQRRQPKQSAVRDRTPASPKHQAPPAPPVLDDEVIASLVAAGVENDDLEYSLSESTTGRKGFKSLNHLLNFSFPEREQPVTSSAPASARRSRRVVAYNKERYVHAKYNETNFRFVLSPSGSFEPNLFDPDIPVNWSDIQQVIMTTHAEPCCPICLSKPMAARITKCGHVYCWVCVLHYLSLGEKRWRRCPICYDAVYADDLQSAYVQTINYYVEGDQLEMHLLKRSKAANVAAPVSKWHQDVAHVVPVYSTKGQRDPYAKLQVASADLLRQIVERETYDLMVQYIDTVTDGGDMDTLRCIEDAMTRVQARASSARMEDITASLAPYLDGTMRIPTNARAAQPTLQQLPPPPSPKLTPKPSTSAESVVPALASSPSTSSAPGSWKAFSELEPALQPATATTTNSQTPRSRLNSQSDEEYEAAFSSEGDEETDQSDSDDSTGSVRSGIQIPTHDKRRNEVIAATSNAYYFYQAADGQHLYLHPLDMRILLEEYGSYEHFPERLQGRIVEIEEISQSEDARRRYKLLKHLPLTCEFSLVELDLSKGLVSRSTLALFSNELQQRERRRQLKVRKEKETAARNEPTPKKQFAMDNTFPSLGQNNSSSALPTGDEWGPLPSAGRDPQSPPLGPTTSYARAVGGIMSDPLIDPPLPSRAPQAPQGAWARSPTKTSSWSEIAAKKSNPEPSPPLHASAASDQQQPPLLDLDDGEEALGTFVNSGKKGKKKMVLLSTTSFRRY